MQGDLSPLHPAGRVLLRCFAVARWGQNDILIAGRGTPNQSFPALGSSGLVGVVVPPGVEGSAGVSLPVRWM